MITSEDLLKVEQQLGRSPRGIKEVVCYNKNGWPRVVRVSPMVAGKPFPSHYWLTCEILKKEIDRIEADGWVKKLENEYLAKDEDLREKVAQDHKSYIEDRMNFIKEDGLEGKIEQKYWSSLSERGVGGIQDFSRVRCMHMHYAHHLAKGSTIGRLMDELFGLDKL